MIITLCGSARFEAWYHMWNEALSLSGHCVFGLGAYPSQHEGRKDWYSEDEKRKLDAVHLAKISASDAVLFLNVMAYMGESTLREFEWAQMHRKGLYFLESWGKGCGIGGNHFKQVQDAFHRFGLKGGSPIDAHTFSPAWDLLPSASLTRSALVQRLNDREDAALGYKRSELRHSWEKRTASPAP